MQRKLFIWLRYVLILTLTISYIERYVLRWDVWISGMRFCDLRKIIEVLLKRILYLFWYVLGGLSLELYELSLRKWGGMRICDKREGVDVFLQWNIPLWVLLGLHLTLGLLGFFDPLLYIDIVVIFILVAMLYKFLSGYEIKTAIDIELNLRSLGFRLSFEVLDHCYLRNFIVV